MRENTDQKKIGIWTPFRQCKLNPIRWTNVNATEKIVARLLQHVFQNSIKKHKPHEINYAILRSSTSSGKTLLKIPKLLLPLFSVDFWFLSDRLLFSLFFWDFNMLVTNILMQFLLWHLDLTWNKKILHPPSPPAPKWTFHTCNILNVLETVIGIISDVIWCKSSFSKVCFRKKNNIFC